MPTASPVAAARATRFSPVPQPSSTADAGRAVPSQRSGCAKNSRSGVAARPVARHGSSGYGASNRDARSDLNAPTAM